MPLLPGGRCSCLHDSWEERHSLLLHKMGAGLTESRKNGRFQAVPVLLPAFVDIFKESGQIKDKVFVFFFQPPNGIKEFFYSFFFHDSSEIQKMDTAVIRVRFHFVFFQVNSRTGQNNLTICRYDVSFAKFAGVFFIFKKDIFYFSESDSIQYRNKSGQYWFWNAVPSPCTLA